jgi:hypothetical protein
MCSSTVVYTIQRNDTKCREESDLELSKMVAYSSELIRPSLVSTVITQALELKHTTSAVHSRH